MSFLLVFISEGFLYALFDLIDPDLGLEGLLRIDGWNYWLRNYSDQNFAKLISGILLSGAKIGYRGSPLNHRNPNY